MGFTRDGEALGSVKIDSLPDKAKKALVKEIDEANEASPSIEESKKAEAKRAPAGLETAGGAAAAGVGPGGKADPGGKTPEKADKGKSDK